MTSQYAGLTLNDLYSIHSQIYTEVMAEHAKLIDQTTPDRLPLVEVCGPEWQAISAVIDTLNAQCESVYAEIQRRELDLDNA